MRERLELVEGILKNNSQDYDELVSAQIKSIMENYYSDVYRRLMEDGPVCPNCNHQLVKSEESNNQNIDI